MYACKYVCPVTCYQMTTWDADAHSNMYMLAVDPPWYGMARAQCCMLRYMSICVMFIVNVNAHVMFMFIENVMFMLCCMYDTNIG